MPRYPRLLPLDDRDPLRVMFVITVMPVGGAETLLVNLVRRMDRARFSPELCCLKHFGPLGEVLANEIPAFQGLISHKYDFRVWGRLTKLLRDRGTDAVITVGTGGDKMFWGRLAAWRARVPVVLSALHSTGVPDCVEFPNRLLAPITDGFIGVAASHANYLAENEGCPREKVFVIPNGVDVDRFCPTPPDEGLRRSLGLGPGPVATIVAALRPEKNHELFLRGAQRILQEIPDAQFLVVGDGPRRDDLVQLCKYLSIEASVRFLGTRSDIPQILALSNVFTLTSHMEANPVSILEALACETPVVAPRVGSIPETVIPGETGFLFEPDDVEQYARHVLSIFNNPELESTLGSEGRRRVEKSWSLDSMVNGYQDLITGIYRLKSDDFPQVNCWTGNIEDLSIQEAANESVAV